MSNTLNIARPSDVSERWPRVVLYARAGRPEGLEAQLRYLREVAAMYGWTAVEISEVRAYGISEQALAALDGADMVLVSELNRLSRRVPDVLELYRALAAAGVRLRTPEDLGYHPQAATVPVAAPPVAEGASRRLEPALELIAALERAGREAQSARMKAGKAAAKARREAL